MDPYSKSTPNAFSLRTTETQFDERLGINQKQDYSTLFKWFDTVSGNRNPYWRDQIRARQCATTPCNGHFFELVSEPFVDAIYTGYKLTGVPSNPTYDATYTSLGMPSHAIGLISTFLPFLPSASEIALATAKANRDFINKAKSAMSSVEAGQDLGEWKETIRTITHPLQSVKELTLGYLASVKKHKAKYKKVSLRKAVTDSYLEWNFGIRPLTEDIAAAIVGLQNKRFTNAVSIHGFGKVDFQSSVGYVDGSDRAPPCSLTTRSYGRYSIRIKGLVDTSNNGPIPDLARELQLAPEDFAPTAWDLVPYSWVVDYFTNVGDIISAVSFPSSRVAWVNTTIHNERYLEIGFNFAGDPLGKNLAYTMSLIGSAAGPFICKSVDWSRTGTLLPNFVPPLVFTIPVSVKPWENIAAILSQQIKSIVPLRF